jgi:hypothetical protein
MEAPTGGLNQVSAQQKRPAPAVGKFDPNAAQAENLEEISKSKPIGLKEKIVDDLGDQREAMNAALVRMRESLDLRKNRMFDPVLMQTAAGFLKPTKTGSFGESLGNAAENAGVASEREMLRQAENQKLEMELLSKEQEFRQQLGGDQLMSALLGGPRTGASTTAPAPAGGAVMSQTGAPRVSGTASPVDLTTPSGQQQVVAGVRSGRIQVTDEILAVASRVAPKMLPFLQEMRKSQVEEEKNRIAQEDLAFKKKTEKRKIIPRGSRTEREVDREEYDEYQQKLAEFRKDKDVDKLLNYYDSKGWLESEQVMALDAKPSNVKPAVSEALQTDVKPLTDGKTPTGGVLPTDGASTVGGTSTVGSASTVGATSTASPVGSSQVPRAKTQSQLDEEKARKELEIAVEKKRRESEIEVEASGQSETQKERAKAAEARGNSVLARGENAMNMEALATDVLSLTDSNARAFNLMQNATVRDSVLRAIEQGASVTAGPMTVALNLPVRVALQGNKEYQLTKQDIEALQVFQQKQSAITAEMRKMARTPGEGATDKAEGQLYAAIGILPTDSAKVLALKSEAMIQRARYDARAAELWSQFQDKEPNKTFTYFQQNNPEFKELQKNYVRTLNDMREKNADMLRSSPKKASSTSNQPSGDGRKPPAGWKRNSDGTFSRE